MTLTRYLFISLVLSKFLSLSFFVSSFVLFSCFTYFFHQLFTFFILSLSFLSRLYLLFLSFTFFLLCLCLFTSSLLPLPLSILLHLFHVLLVLSLSSSTYSYCLQSSLFFFTYPFKKMLICSAVPHICPTARYRCVVRLDDHCYLRTEHLGIISCLHQSCLFCCFCLCDGTGSWYSLCTTLASSCLKSRVWCFLIRCLGLQITLGRAVSC
jgi:hypothetical protein